MARRTRSSPLETRTARLKLAVRKKPYFVVLAPGIAVGFRRNQGAGVWIVRCTDGHGGVWTKRFAIADDHEEANGDSVLSYWEAQDRARSIARGSERGGDKPATVGDALDAYEADLLARGARTANATRVRFNLPDTLAAKTVALLSLRELRSWRDGLVKNGMTPATADRTAGALKAALSLAATDDKRIANKSEWTALKRLPEGDIARNVILPDDKVRDVVSAAYAVDRHLGALIETLAVTGARQSQAFGLCVRDLQDGNGSPRLLMPSSRKGRRRSVERRPVPITSSLAATLRELAAGRPADAPLLLRSNGEAWRVDDARRAFVTVAERAGIDATITPYSLRHSSIVRQLLRNVPVRIVADSHDTSIRMIEKHYSAFISDHSDALTRRALLDLVAPDGGNVVTLAGR
jgi:integrase